MSTKEAYVAVKQRDLQEMESEIAALEDPAAKGVQKLHNACQSARSMLDRIVKSDDDKWESLQPTVDAAFRSAYDCLRQIKT